MNKWIGIKNTIPLTLATPKMKYLGVTNIYTRSVQRKLQNSDE